MFSFLYIKTDIIFWLYRKRLILFNIRKIRDKIKKEFCKKNNIKFHIITYKNNIEKKLNEILL